MWCLFCYGLFSFVALAWDLVSNVELQAYDSNGRVGVTCSIFVSKVRDQLPLYIQKFLMIALLSYVLKAFSNGLEGVALKQFFFGQDPIPPSFSSSSSAVVLYQCDIGLACFQSKICKASYCYLCVQSNR